MWWHPIQVLYRLAHHPQLLWVLAVDGSKYHLLRVAHWSDPCSKINGTLINLYTPSYATPGCTKPNEWLVWRYKVRPPLPQEQEKHCGINLLWLPLGLGWDQTLLSTYLLSKWAIQFYSIYVNSQGTNEEKEIAVAVLLPCSPSFEILPQALTSL